MLYVCMCNIQCRCFFLTLFLSKEWFLIIGSRVNKIREGKVTKGKIREGEGKVTKETMY